MTVRVALAVTLAIAIGTYLLRAIPLLVLADRRLPVVVSRALRNVGPAVLSALVVVSIAVNGDGIVHIEIAEVAALVAAAVVAWWRRNLMWSLVAGMVAMWCVSALPI